MTGPRKMSLGAFVHETGQHVAAWRHPGAFAESGTVFAQAVHVAREAERGKFDLLFLADGAAVSLSGSAESRGRMGKSVKFEPLTILSALAAVTTHLGLVATATSTYNEPYTLARQFASLDQISGGRAGWNLVTSNNEAEAFNYSRAEHVAHADRYDRAVEFAQVVSGLWDSWDEDAFVRDKDSGVYYDTAKMHPLNHRGKYFQVRGPLNVAGSPQGRPVLVQAGASDTGRDLAARMAEVVFTAQTTFEQAREFHTDVMARLARYGRARDEVRVLPGIYPRGRPHRGRGAGKIRVPAIADPSQRRPRGAGAHDRRRGSGQIPAARSGARHGRHQRPAQPASVCCWRRRGATI